MNKAEVLAKSREENKDEGLENAKYKGHKIGMIVVSFMFVVLVIYNLVKELNNYAIFALYWTYFGFENYGIYKFTKHKVTLASAILGLFTGIVFFITYIVSTVG